MAEESKKDTIRNSTLHTLVNHVGLTPQEITHLRLADLHLAGKSPNIKFIPVEGEEAKTIELDLDAHRALVGWLVARPDSTNDYLFPGQGADPIAEEQITQWVDQVDQAPDTTAPAKPPLTGRSPISPPGNARPGATPPPPRSAPELGAPPPGMTPLGGTFTPPPTAPESDEPVNMPLPTAAPKPPPSPPEPVKPPQPAQKSPSPVAGAKGLAKPEAAKAGPTGLTSDEATPAPPKVKQPVVKRSGKGSRLAVIAGAIAVLLLCAGCFTGGWFISQSEPGSQLLARLGIGGTIVPFDDADIMASLTPPPTNTPQPTPTLPPTSTPTPAATETPTATPPPTDTPPPSDTPVLVEQTPTDTPTPDTPTPQVSADTPTPAATPTPAMKYGTPVLIEPEDRASFIVGNIIVLKWQPVGELAPDEQYAVRLVYQFENQPSYQGTNLRSTEWEVPPSLYGQIDGPENRYEWFVVVERLNDDGSGTAISPESERRTFIWK